MQIYNIRGKRVVLDRELAAALGVETRVINQKVKRNVNLFNEDSMFQLTFDECAELEISGSKSQNSGLSSQFVISNSTGRGGSRHLPFAFTEAGFQVLKTLMKSSVNIDFSDEPPLPAVYEESWNEGTVVLYQPNENIKIDVRVENETVWLAQEQMALLFGTTQPNIAMHIRNIFDDGELEIGATYKDFLYVQTEGGKQKSRYIKIYNLDMIISVGYRVNTRNGIAFRQWATKVIKQHLMHKGSFEHRVQLIENNIKSIEQQQIKHTQEISDVKQKVEFIVDTKIPPVEQIFMQGQFFDAYKLFSDLIRSAKERVIIIDNYVDESVLKLLSKRADGVIGVIYTSEKCYHNETFKLDLQKYNAQYAPVDVYPMSKVHDRFMIIDDVLYSSGGSFKDAGKKLFSFEKMTLSPDVILQLVSN